MGFDLTIPKSEWYVSEDEIEPLETQMERIEKEIWELDKKLEVAENRAKKESDLREIRKTIQKKDNILTQFDRLNQWQTVHESRDKCEEKQRILKSDLGKMQENIWETDLNTKRVRKHLESLHTKLNSIEKTVQETGREHQNIKTFSTEYPPNIQNIPETDLEFEYRQGKSRVGTRMADLKRLQDYQAEHRILLESRYELESPDMDFDQWIEQNMNITAQNAKFESQLYQSYNNLFTRIKGEMDKFIQAFDVVRDRVATLNRNIKNVSISNIECIELNVKENQTVKAIKKICQRQPGLFSIDHQDCSSEQAREILDDYLSTIRDYGREINLEDMFQLTFSVRFNRSTKPVYTQEIHKFESHGTETGIKIILYLGLISLLQEKRQALSARIPFFLDEVGSIDSHNLKQLIRYCSDNNFLPIFASPDIRNDVPYNYIFKREGKRSILMNEIFITEPEVSHNEASPVD